jgi:hypothetical protein
MRRESQLAAATYLRSAIWNWIDLFPREFNKAVRVRGKMEGAPERVFDLLSSNITSGQEKIYWPTLTILLCCTFDKIRGELNNVAPTSMGRRVFVSSSSSRLADVALTCAIDVCRAAAYVDTGLGDVILLEIAADMAHEIKVRKRLLALLLGLKNCCRVPYISPVTQSDCSGRPIMRSTSLCIPSPWWRCIAFWRLRTHFRYSKHAWTPNASKLAQSVRVSVSLRIQSVSSSKGLS